MTQNMKRALTKLNLETEAQLRNKLALMPEEDRKVFEAKWGIDERGNFCPNYALLDKKLGVEYGSRRLYEKALRTFENVGFIECFGQQQYDRKTFNERLAYGKLLHAICGEEVTHGPFEERRSSCNELLDRLSEREAYVLKERFGLDGESPKLLGEVGKELKVTRERVRQIESKAIRKGRRLFDEPLPETPMEEETDTDIEDIDIVFTE